MSGTLKPENIAIVFDFDGTLIDSKKVKIDNYVKAFYDIFDADRGALETVYESCRHTAGANRFVQLQDTLERLKMRASDEEKERWSKRYSWLNKESLSKIEEFPSVRKMLTGLMEKGFRVFAASGILDDEFKMELAKRKLDKYFEDIRGGDKVGFLKLLKKRGFKRIIFVGDTKYDDRAAKEADVEFYRIENNSDIVNLFHMLVG